MGKSNRVALLSLFLIASASPSFAHATKTDSGLRTTAAERMIPTVSPQNWVATRHLGPKACNYRGGPKTGTWSCERTSNLINGASLR
ncbi:hypothetical protein GCM10022626_10440 [[Pseudomonas] carboxydohydrogena]|jgi:hypothetical protein